MSNLDLSGAAWKKSSRSSQGNECVEVAVVRNGAGVRDTKDRDAGHFAVSPAAWGAFLGAVLDDTTR
jgi:Domain of unknown function (DUF397)